MGWIGYGVGFHPLAGLPKMPLHLHGRRPYADAGGERGVRHGGVWFILGSGDVNVNRSPCSHRFRSHGNQVLFG
jgi:hypothetical protein